MSDLGLTSGQYYGMGYGYSQMPQLERSACTSRTSTSARISRFWVLSSWCWYCTTVIAIYSDGTSSTQSSLPTGARQHSSIILMDLFLLITGMTTMMILSLIAIQCGNDYIMQVFMKVCCEIYSICIYFDILIPWRMYLYIRFMFTVLGDMFWTCYTSILMSTIF